MCKFDLVLRTLRHLKGQQLWGQLRNRLPRSMPVLKEIPEVVTPEGEWTEGIVKQQGYLGGQRFEFLNVSSDFTEAGGWWGEKNSYLWYYNLNYFEWINQGECTEALPWILRWIDENKPSPSNRAWDPYPVSLRIINWVRYFLENSSIELAHESLAFQAKWLMGRIETHLLGNHYLVNGFALFFAGIYFKGLEADRWLAKGWTIIEKELPREVHRDGGHFERSPMYHSLILEDVLNLLNLSRTYQKRCPVGLGDLCEKTADRMLSWLSGMTYDDGTFPLFNDAVCGIASSREDLEKYADRLSLKFKPTHRGNGTCYYEDTGFARMRKARAILFAEVGGPGPSYQPGHSHAGTLGFEFMIAGHKLLVDTGTNTYEACDERVRQRSTLSHNTLIVDGCDSSEVWRSFRIGRRAIGKYLHHTSNNETSELTLSAEHNGYKLAGLGGIHRRLWSLSERRLGITDSIDLFNKVRPIEIRFHFAPDTILIKDSDNRWVVRKHGVIGFIYQENGFIYGIEDYDYCPRFGVSIPSQRLIARTDSSEVKVTHKIEWSLDQ